MLMKILWPNEVHRTCTSQRDTKYQLGNSPKRTKRAHYIRTTHKSNRISENENRVTALLFIHTKFKKKNNTKYVFV